MKKYCIDKKYKHYASNMACSLAQKVINRAKKDKNINNIENIIEEVIFDFAHTDCFNYDNQWLILITYCSPLNANYQKALDLLYQDIYNLIEVVEE